MSQRWVGCLALPLLAACASTGGLLGIRTTRGPLPDPAAMDSGLAAARVAIDTAAGRGDASAIARYFAADVLVVIGRDSLRGFPAVAAYYRAARPRAAGGRIEFRPNRTELCVDGASELGGTMFLVTRNGDGTADTLQPNYAVRWVLDGAGAWRIAAITLRSQSVDRAISAGGGCRTILALARFPRKRVLLTLQSPWGVTQSPTLNSVQTLFTARSYSAPGPRQSGDPVIGLLGLYPKVEETAPLTAGLRVRVAGPITGEILGSVLGNHVTVTAADVPGRSYVSFNARQRAVGALIGFEWRRLRLAAGPVWFGTSGSLVERYLVFISGVGWGGRLRTDEAWSSSSVGWTALAAYTLPFTASLFAEVRARWQGVTTDFDSPSTVFPSARLESSGYTLSVSVGVAP